MRKDELEKIVNDFHDLLMENKDMTFCKDDGGVNHLVGFPGAKCEIGSSLLQKHLRDKYSYHTYLVKRITPGNIPSCLGHIYLENKDYIIDLTINQFEGQLDIEKNKFIYDKELLEEKLHPLISEGYTIENYQGHWESDKVYEELFEKIS